MLIFANELSLKLKNGINEIINFHSGAAVYWFNRLGKHTI